MAALCGGKDMEFVVTSEGLVADGKSAQSAALTALLARVPENATVRFPAGDYYFPETVTVEGKKGLKLVGSRGTRLISHFGPSGDPKENNDLFHFCGCADITVEDFTVTTDNPIGWAGVVTAVNPEEHYYEVRIHDEFPVTGMEHLETLNTCDADGTPDYIFDGGGGIYRENETVIVDGEEVTRYAGLVYEVIGDHLVRFPVPAETDLHCLPIGEQMCYRFVRCGGTDFYFEDTDRVVLRNIEIERASGVGLYIAPRCSDFTLDRFCIRLRADTRALYAGNKDGIHIRGLTGYLRMTDCHFNGLGDDALNIHGTAGEIMETAGDGYTIRYRYCTGVHDLDGNWAREGDILDVYDPNSFLRKGKIRVMAWDGLHCKGELTEGKAEPGDAVANTAYFAATHISDCTVRNTRARGFLLQTHDVRVEDCYVFGMSLPAIILAPDIRVWYEVGPSENVVIRNNLFEKCAFVRYGANLGAIVVKGSHDVGAADYPAGVHRRMTIEENTFRGMGNSGIYVSATDTLKIRNNRFTGCGSNLCNTEDISLRADIVTRNCAHLQVEGNVTDRDPAMVWYAIGCEEEVADGPQG